MRLATYLVMALSSCYHPPAHIDPPKGYFKTTAEAYLAASSRVENEGMPHFTSGTSMEPLIHTGDFVVLKKVPFSEVQLGKVYGVNYLPGSITLHRAIFKDGFGIKTEGDSAEHADMGFRMTADNIEGECTYIATTHKD